MAANKNSLDHPILARGRNLSNFFLYSCLGIAVSTKLSKIYSHLGENSKQTRVPSRNPDKRFQLHNTFGRAASLLTRCDSSSLRGLAVLIPFPSQLSLCMTESQGTHTRLPHSVFRPEQRTFSEWFSRAGNVSLPEL